MTTVDGGAGWAAAAMHHRRWPPAPLPTRACFVPSPAGPSLVTAATAAAAVTSAAAARRRRRVCCGRVTAVVGGTPDPTDGEGGRQPVARRPLPPPPPPPPPSPPAGVTPQATARDGVHPGASPSGDPSTLRPPPLPPPSRPSLPSPRPPSRPSSPSPRPPRLLAAPIAPKGAAASTAPAATGSGVTVSGDRSADGGGGTTASATIFAGTSPAVAAGHAVLAAALRDGDLATAVEALAALAALNYRSNQVLLQPLPRTSAAMAAAEAATAAAAAATGWRGGKLGASSVPLTGGREAAGASGPAGPRSPRPTWTRGPSPPIRKGRSEPPLTYAQMHDVVIAAAQADEWRLSLRALVIMHTQLRYVRRCTSTAVAAALSRVGRVEELAALLADLSDRAAAMRGDDAERDAAAPDARMVGVAVRTAVGLDRLDVAVAMVRAADAVGIPLSGAAAAALMAGYAAAGRPEAVAAVAAAARLGQLSLSPSEVTIATDALVRVGNLPAARALVADAAAAGVAVGVQLHTVLLRGVMAAARADGGGPVAALAAGLACREDMGRQGVVANAVTRNVLVEAAVAADDWAAVDALLGEYGLQPPLPSLVDLTHPVGGGRIPKAREERATRGRERGVYRKAATNAATTDATLATDFMDGNVLGVGDEPERAAGTVLGEEHDHQLSTLGPWALPRGPSRPPGWRSPPSAAIDVDDGRRSPSSSVAAAPEAVASEAAAERAAVEEAASEEAAARNLGIAITSVVAGLSRAGRIDDALAVVGRMERAAVFPAAAPDLTIAYTAILSSLVAQSRGIARAWALFRGIRRKCTPSVVTYTVMISALCRRGDIRSVEAAAGLLDEARALAGMSPRAVSAERGAQALASAAASLASGSSASASASTRALATTTASPTEGVASGTTAASAAGTGWLRPPLVLNEAIHNALFDGLATTGQTARAEAILWHMHHVDGIAASVRSFTTLLAGYANERNLDAAARVFRSMAAVGVAPDRAALNALLASAARVGDVPIAERVIDAMARAGGKLSPDGVSYGALVSAYVTAGDLLAAFDVYDAMKRPGKGGGRPPGSATTGAVANAPTAAARAFIAAKAALNPTDVAALTATAGGSTAAASAAAPTAAGAAPAGQAAATNDTPRAATAAPATAAAAAAVPPVRRSARPAAPARGREAAPPEVRLGRSAVDGYITPEASTIDTLLRAVLSPSALAGAAAVAAGHRGSVDRGGESDTGGGDGGGGPRRWGRPAAATAPAELRGWARRKARRLVADARAMGNAYPRERLDAWQRTVDGLVGRE